MRCEDCSEGFGGGLGVDLQQRREQRREHCGGVRRRCGPQPPSMVVMAREGTALPYNPLAVRPPVDGCIKAHRRWVAPDAPSDSGSVLTSRLVRVAPGAPTSKAVLLLAAGAVGPSAHFVVSFGGLAGPARGEERMVVAVCGAAAGSGQVPCNLGPTFVLSCTAFCSSSLAPRSTRPSQSLRCFGYQKTSP